MDEFTKVKVMHSLQDYKYKRAVSMRVGNSVGHLRSTKVNESQRKSTRVNEGQREATEVNNAMDSEGVQKSQKLKGV